MVLRRFLADEWNFSLRGFFGQDYEVHTYAGLGVSEKRVLLDAGAPEVTATEGA
jgi:hypothetical protein